GSGSQARYRRENRRKRARAILNLPMDSFGECEACDEMFELARTAAGLLPDIDIKIDYGQRRRREIAAHPREFRFVTVPGQKMRQFGEAGIVANKEEKFGISRRLGHHLLKRA